MAVEGLEQRYEAGNFGPRYDGMESIGAPAELLLIPCDQLIMLAQVRSGTNPIHEQLKDSIQNRGLQSEVGVARMTGPDLEKYISFVNGLWGSTYDLSMFDPSPDGYHYLVIAGHSRTAAIQELAKERQTVFGVPCKVYDANTPEEIIAHQLDENIHSRPSPEREAMAIVESYFYGLQEGMWENKGEFLKSAKNKFSRYALDRALIFTEIPTDIRQFVLDGALPYSVGIELGRAARVAKKYFAEKYAAETEEVAMAVRDWLQLTIARIHNSKELSRRSSKAQKFIIASSNALEANLAEHKAAGNQTLFELSLVEEAAPISRELREKIGELGAEPLRDLATVVSLHFGIRDDGEKHTIRQEIEKAKETVGSYLSRLGMEAHGVELQEQTLSLLEAA